MIKTLLATTALVAFVASSSFAEFLSQTSGRLQASQLIGETVYVSEAADAENVGEIDDLVVGTDGNIDAAIISVGGFLGVGEKDVAVSFDSLKFVDRDGDRYVILETTKEALEGAPKFEVQARATPATPAADTTAPVPPTASANMSDDDCNAAWVSADANKDGALDNNEKARYVAALRVADRPGTDATMTQEVFMENCRAGYFQTASTPEAGAPFEGANSFTEGQAQDRILAAGFSNVSALQKDDKGIWRGTAQSQGKEVNIAVDYKGNVVADNN